MVGHREKLRQLAQADAASAEVWIAARAAEAWAVETLGIFWRAINLTRGDTTLMDWLDPFVDLPRIREDRAGFGRMLLYEADAGRMVRNWLRWAVRFLQVAAKIKPSNPRDEQLASYLPDADLFFTSDKPLFRIVTAINSAAPAACAVPHLIRPSSPNTITGQIEAALGETG